MPQENQDYRKFTTRAELDKAMSSLDGILLGITMDQRINEKEINELKRWVEAHQELVSKYPFQDFAQSIQELEKEDIPVDEILLDMKWLINKNKRDNEYYDGYTMDLQTLQGICHGILADGVINDEEIVNLQNWIDENEHLAKYYPYDEIRSLLVTILQDGIIEEHERKMLLALLNDFVFIQDDQVRQKIEEELSDVKLISGLCTFDPSVEFENHYFCITGTLTRGNRGDLVNQIISAGGSYVNNVSSKTNYLVVGDSGNPAWAFACYGRKVEKAIKLRKDGQNIMIVHEFDFWDILDDHL